MNTFPLPATRREFLRRSTLASAVALAAPAILVREKAFAANTDTIKIGLVGCGGRGTGAAGNAMDADPNLILTAVGDAFADQAEKSLAGLREQYKERVAVTPEKTFTGLDAYKKVIDSGVDVVLLATPPGFRPFHLRYAVEAGKNIFCEKPMATDAPMLRHVMESVRISKEKKLNLVAGFCWRYDQPRQAFYRQVHDGALGEIAAVYGTYLTGPVKSLNGKKPAGTKDLEWQMRNWMNYTWLSGDGIVEQCIHTVDKAMWAFKDVPPVKCTANGGRNHPNYDGNIFDHVTVVYEWANGSRAIIAQRQEPGCFSDNSDYLLGTTANGWSGGWNAPYIKSGDQMKWKYRGEKPPDMYVLEHQQLYKAVRGGAWHNDGDWMASSTMTGIMGRMAGYTGAEVTWDQAMNSQQSLVPKEFSWDMDLPVAPIARPGITKFI